MRLEFSREFLKTTLVKGWRPQSPGSLDPHLSTGLVLLTFAPDSTSA
jgi:hypothetical protein